MLYRGGREWGTGQGCQARLAEEQRRTTVVYLIEKVAHCHAQQKAKASGVPASLPRGRSNVAAKEPLSPVSSSSPPSSSFFFPFPSPSLSCSPSIPPPPSSAFLCFSLRLDPPPTLLPFPTWHVVSFIRKEEKGWEHLRGETPKIAPEIPESLPSAETAKWRPPLQPPARDQEEEK